MTISRRMLLGYGAFSAFAGASPVWARPVNHAHPGQAAPAQTARAGSAHKGKAKPPGPVVMLDPGHGGKDPGAIGYAGTYEKHVAFAAAEALRQQLLAGGYRVLLTRAGDHFIPLEDRVAIAQQHGAALFVSMHADSVGDHRVRGASVYTLSGTASDAQSEALARRENSADRFATPQFRNQPPEVAHILASLVRQETNAGSARIQRGMVGALGQDTALLENPARHAAFVVLKAADIPSVLVEMGFMSNPQDEALLKRADHRAKLVMAMRHAVDGYFAGQTAA